MRQLPNKPVNREAVRILAIEHGYKKAAELSGLNYHTVRKWGLRFNWKAIPTHAKSIVSNVSPADSLTREHAKNKQRSKTALGIYAAAAAEEAARSPRKLKVARAVRDVAAVHSTLWPEDHNERGILNLSVLAGAVALQVNPGVSE